jgi:hypothetical protein
MIGDHTEAIQVVSDTNLLDYDQLLNTFFKDFRHSAADSGTDSRYFSGIWYHDEEQRGKALAAKVTRLSSHCWASFLLTVGCCCSLQETRDPGDNVLLASAASTAFHASYTIAGLTIRAMGPGMAAAERRQLK